VVLGSDSEVSCSQKLRGSVKVGMEVVTEFKWVLL